MDFVKRFVLFWYDFIVGDDWVVAVGVLAVLGVAAVLARSEIDYLAWVFVPVAVVLVLSFSLWRAIRTG